MVKRMFLLIGLWLFFVAPAVAFDHSHAAWNSLLRQHVHWDDEGVASRVDYRAMHAAQDRLNAYLASLSAVSLGEYQGWSKRQQLAFLINAYNAFTIKLVLSEYPQLESIKELGSLFSSPWKKRFFTLLGEKRHLDELEHGLIRQPGVFDDPRIHVAVVCASIGCPALRNEAFVAEQLNQQLEDSLRRFLSDRRRNRYNASTERLEVSKIFDWYGDDFIGYRGHPSVASFLGEYAELLSDDESARRRIRGGNVPLAYLDYDWRLNDYHP